MKECAVCKKDFSTVNSKKIYCGKTCVTVAYHRRNAIKLKNKRAIRYQEQREKILDLARKSRLNRSSEVRRSYKLKQRYGISVEEFNELLNKQQHKCAICKSVEPGANTKNFHVDHCHVTGKVRGLLCNGCNRGLGFFNDDVEKMKNAIEYLNNES